MIFLKTVLYIYIKCPFFPNTRDENSIVFLKTTIALFQVEVLVQENNQNLAKVRDKCPVNSIGIVTSFVPHIWKRVGYEVDNRYSCRHNTNTTTTTKIITVRSDKFHCKCAKAALCFVFQKIINNTIQ